MNSLKILAIDDDKDILTLVRHLLEKKNYTVFSADSGKAALRILENTKPDLILLDVIMENMSGYEVCHRILSHDEWSFIPVIFLTALTSEKARDKAISLGAVDFLSKPVKKEQLYGLIRKHASIEGRWRLFLEQKKSVRKQLTKEKTGNRDIHFNAFRKFLFEFLAITDNDRKRLDSLSTDELAKALQDTQRLSQTRYAILMAQFTRMAFLPEIAPETILLDVLPVKYARHNNVVPISTEAGLGFVVTDPFNVDLLDTLSTLKPHRIFLTSPEVVSFVYGIRPGDSDETLDSLARGVRSLFSDQLPGSSLEEDPFHFNIDLNASPLVHFVNKLLEQAYLQEASDIHIEPRENNVAIRFRIDGELMLVQQLQPRSLINIIVSRIKIMAQMNISERRLPQDGRFSFRSPGRTSADFDVRVSSAPLNFGEKIVMRILNKGKALMPFEKLGFSKQALEEYRGKLASPYGMILHVGPTGSGKSMSLYSALNEINRPNINIQTVEDPIEYTLDGISQLQIKPDIGLTFQEALRCFLRQDPDVLLVGEIRDRETAMMAIEASLTGHLIFSTLHTNDAPSTVIRFIEMGIAPYLVSSSIILICAQRLLKRLCTKCKIGYEPDESEKQLAGIPSGKRTTFYRPQGCPACNQTGYRGRIGAYEFLAPNDIFREAINLERISVEQIRKTAVAHCGMTSLFDDALEKVKNGITSMAEAVSKTKV
ncbi:MAG TPA: secretion system protein E [Desulfobacteraceae bacterium]|nr:secretion system protein E [Desulfobacteraceae bacterium]|tara:strand:- start:504 stop:2639 length:2136 start_codon:yes stop_codon:yes gene_type:complete